MRYKRTQSDCITCSLRDCNRVYGEGPMDAKILFLGEAPGEEEDATGNPFVGPAGRILSLGLGTANILRHRCYIMNILCCRPPNNKFDSFEALDGRRKCNFKEELDFMIGQNVKVIGALGKSAYNALGIEGLVRDVRGSVYTYKDIPIVPTYHPSMFNYSYKKKDSVLNPFPVWVNDLRKIKEISETGYKRLPENFQLYPSLGDLEAFINSLEPNQLLAGDIETQGRMRKGGDIVVLGIAKSSTDAISVPFLCQGGTLYWSPPQESKVRKLLNHLFQNFKWIFQNALFDVRELKDDGYHIDYDCIAHDTMIMHHIISPELDHDLGFITSQYGKTPSWKPQFQKPNMRILDKPDNETRTYNLRDCVVLHQIFPPMLKDIKENNLMEPYIREMQLLPAIDWMQCKGVLLDEEVLEKWKKKKIKSLDGIESSLHETGKLPLDFNLGSDDHMRYFLYGIIPPQMERAVAKLSATKEIKAYLWECKNCGWKHHHIRKTVPPKCGCETPKLKRLDQERMIEVPLINPETKEYHDLGILRYIHDHVSPITTLSSYRGRKTKKKKNLAVNKDALLSYSIALKNRLNKIQGYRGDFTEEIQNINKLLKFLKDFSNFKELRKLVTTYTNFDIYPDGRIRTSFLPHGTVTGRLSCVSENTFIETYKGLCKINKIRPGDHVLTHTGRYQKVNKLVYKGIDKMYRIMVSCGSTIECTKDHRMLTPQGWRKVKDIHVGSEVYYVNKQKRSKKQRISKESSGSLSFRRETNNPADQRYCGDNLSFSDVHCKSQPVSKRLQNRKSPTLLKIKTWFRKSYVWKIWEGTSQLYRRLFRPKRIFNKGYGWASLLFPPYCDERVTGNTSERLAKDLGDTSYRWKWRKQQFKQSGNSDKDSTQTSSYEISKVLEKTSLGTMGVWDVQVEEDESYIAHGLIHHNSSGPNLMNLPVRTDPDFRKCFTVPKGYIWLKADYKNIEVYILALESGDEILLNDLLSGKDIHDENTKILFEIKKSDPLWKIARRAAKIFMFGGLSYGGTKREIFLKVANEAPELPLTFSQFSQAIDRWMDAHPAYSEWKERTISEALQERQISNFRGRVRQLMGSEKDIPKQALNTPVQGGAAEIMNESMVILRKKFHENNFKSSLLLQVHDELDFEIYKPELIKTKTIIKSTMEREIDYRGKLFSFPVDIEIGENWGSLK